MDSIYWIIIGALLVLALFDLFNGVANDAVNFLNSAIGSKAAKVRTILIVASIGVLVGATFSGGMMEVARNGIFHPDMFSFHEVMLLFLAVMISEVILLDAFNTFGLPTSTTVSLVFGILGSAVSTALYKISNSEVNESVWNFINTDKSFEIVTGILLSVAIAFSIGAFVMWVSRLSFSFRYQNRFKWFGGLWCGFAMTSIAYFALFKGLKQSTLIEPKWLQMLESNMTLSLFASFIIFSLLMYFLQYICRVNILKITVLAGTFSLALAFAGNDLVNFIGVFVAGLDSFRFAADVVADGGNTVGITSMECLMPGYGRPADQYILLVAGIIMVFALWFSKKAKSVIATGVELSRQGEGGIERFGSVPPARALVRSAMTLGKGIKQLVPPRLLVRINRQWDPAPLVGNPKDRVAFDLIRATVNLTVASLLITWATGQKLPLSTTYVTFMVAMGSSLADKAWGSDSAVYRVTGVLTVISGWFLTGFSAFMMAAIIAALLHYGQIYAIIILLLLTITILTKSTIMHRRRENKMHKEHIAQITEENIFEVCGKQISEGVFSIRDIYGDVVANFIEADRRGLKDLNEASTQLSARCTDSLKYDILPILTKMPGESLDVGYHFLRALDHLSESTQSLSRMTQSIYTYVDNNHQPFIPDQIVDLKAVHNDMMKFLDSICGMIQSNDFCQLDYTMAMQQELLQLIAKATKRQIKRAQRNQTRTRSSLLYINMLNEMRFMVVQLNALAIDQRNFSVE